MIESTQTADRIVNKYPNFSGFGITLFCIALCASCNLSQSSSHAGGTSGSKHSGTVDMLCFSSAESRKIVVSNVFPVRTYPPERMIEEPWAKDFRRYIGPSGVGLSGRGCINAKIVVETMQSGNAI